MTESTNTSPNAHLAAKNIGFVGAGNMARAIIHGLLQSGLSKNQVRASVKTAASRAAIEQTLGIEVCNNAELAANSDVIVLCVKPPLIRQVCEEISDNLKPSALVLSVAAGIPCAALEKWLQHDTVIRVMPNTPSSIGLGVSGLYAHQQVSEAQKHIAKSIMESVGIAEFVEQEALIDVVTAVAGSAPAYFFLFFEAMIKSAVAMGLDENTARRFAVHTAIGAGSLAAASDTPIANLRKMVTSPNGTTEQAILKLEEADFGKVVDQAMQACVTRAQELTKELSNHS